jgi:hypothetical protein
MLCHSKALFITKPDMLHRTALRLKNIMYAGDRDEGREREGTERVRKNRSLSCSITMSYVK